MNAQRRKELRRAFDMLSDAKEIIENCNQDEETYRDDMPDNLQGGEKYSNSEESSQAMEDATNEIDSAMGSLETAFQ